MNIPQTDAFLEDVKRRVRERLRAIPIISEEDIENTVKTVGNMTLPFLKKLVEGDIVCEQCGA